MSNKSQKPNSYSPHANFIEALKSSGQSIAKDTFTGIKEDLIKGSATQMVDTVFNRTTSNQETPQEQQPPFNFSEYLNSGEQVAKQRQHDKVKYEYEQVETVIFNRRQQEIQKKIEQIQLELKNLAGDVVGLDETTRTVIQQEIVDPGLYHLNFFERLLTFVRQIRKRVTESRNWAALHSQRGKTKSYFWQQSNKKVGGTKFQLSQERQVATQTG